MTSSTVSYSARLGEDTFERLTLLKCVELGLVAGESPISFWRHDGLAVIDAGEEIARETFRQALKKGYTADPMAEADISIHDHFTWIRAYLETPELLRIEESQVAEYQGSRS